MRQSELTVGYYTVHVTHRSILGRTLIQPWEFNSYLICITFTDIFFNFFLQELARLKAETKAKEDQIREKQV